MGGRDRSFLVDDSNTPEYDNGPGEELGAAELFIAGITTCATLMIERIARAARRRSTRRG